MEIIAVISGARRQCIEPHQMGKDRVGYGVQALIVLMN